MHTVKSIALFVLAACASAVAAQPLQFCNITAGNSSYSLLPLMPAKYDTQVIHDSSIENVTISTGWCAYAINSSSCNATDVKMTITNAAGCENVFSAIFGPPSASASGLLLQFYSEETTAVVNVQLMCDATLPTGTAKLLGRVKRSPSYTYSVLFVTPHACPI